MASDPTPGRVVLYRTDGRNGLAYDLPALVTVTAASHPGRYPDGSANPLPVPDAANVVHLTVLSPGGFGTEVSHRTEDGGEQGIQAPHDRDYPDAVSLYPGSGTYVEWDVPHAGPEHDGVTTDTADPAHARVPPRTWRWPIA